jgi:hypothetical protein
MDFEERLKRAEERRGETREQWMARYREEVATSLAAEKASNATQMLNEGVVKDQQDTAEALADLLASTDDPDILSDELGSLEWYTPIQRELQYLHANIGLEGFGDSLLQLLNRLIAMIKRWLKLFNDSELRLSVSTDMMFVKLEQLKEIARSSGGKRSSTAREFSIESRIPNLCVKYRPIKDATTLLNSLSVLYAVSKCYFTTHQEGVLVPVNSVVTLANSNGTLETVSDQILAVNPLQMVQGSVWRERNGRQESMHLMGNHKLVIHDDGQNGTSDERIRGMSVELMPSIPEPEPMPAEIHFEYFSYSMWNTIVQRIEQVGRLLLDSNNMSKRNARRNRMNSLLSAIERIRDQIQNPVPGLRSEEESRALVAVIETYVSWVIDPYIGFYSYVLRDLKAATNVCEGNLT